jgi:hypothetical protein
MALLPCWSDTAHALCSQMPCERTAHSDMLCPCSRLTALGMDYTAGITSNETIAVLVDALPQLRALGLGDCAEYATDTGMWPA